MKRIRFAILGMLAAFCTVAQTNSAATMGTAGTERDKFLDAAHSYVAPTVRKFVIYSQSACGRASLQARNLTK
jgi:hypothetical protein